MNDDVRYLTDGALTYIEFDTIGSRAAPKEPWMVLKHLAASAADQPAGGPPGASAAGQLSLGRYAPAALMPEETRDLPLSEIFARLAHAAG